MATNMFDRYPQPEDYIPDNRPKCHKPFRLDIMTGETAIHTFEVPLDVDTLEAYEVIYKLGIKPIIIKNEHQTEYSIDDKGHSTITCVLYPEETKLFAQTSLDAKVQIKFYKEDNIVSYSDIYKIKIINSLDATNRETDYHNPTNIVAGVGYGWTED